jgi:hypothetical protein
MTNVEQPTTPPLTLYVKQTVTLPPPLYVKQPATPPPMLYVAQQLCHCAANHSRSFSLLSSFPLRQLQFSLLACSTVDAS